MQDAPEALPAGLGFELQRRFRARPERVFRAWTLPAALREWWCPTGFVAGDIEIDLRVGGGYRIAMVRTADGGRVAVSGRFHVVEPPHRLVYSWRWEGAFANMPETHVTLVLAACSEGTLLTLRHEKFTDSALRQQHRSGWMAACDRLDRVVDSAQSSPAIRAMA